MRIGSLFAGMGGFDLAAESLGWSTAWVSEIDPFACAVLAHHFPNARNLGDITVIDWTQVEPVDVLCAGFPCQPHSLAGKRQASDDSRDLWSECVRAVSLLRPRYFVGENVSGLLTSEGGRFFNRVVSDLAALGYAVEWGTLSAAECGAPHQRSRIFIVAYPADERLRECERQSTEGQASATGGRQVLGHADQCGGVEDSLPAELRPAGHQQRPVVSRPTNAGEGQEIPQGRTRLPDWSDAIPYRGADGTVRLIPRAAVEEIAGTQSEVRPLLDGLPGLVAGRDRGGEVEAWPTPDAGAFNVGADVGTHWKRPNATNTLGIAAGGFDLPASPGSLWPVTESEPGRVAKLRAIGNSVVPLWVVRGPFARVMELDAARTPAPETGNAE